jgi:hypothetical protein
MVMVEATITELAYRLQKNSGKRSSGRVGLLRRVLVIGCGCMISFEVLSGGQNPSTARPVRIDISLQQCLVIK